MLILVLVLIVILLAALLLYASTRPDNFLVERMITIAAPPEKLLPFINDFRQWDAWTPFDKDPAMKKTYSGSATGKGAHYAWEGNKKAGVGDITITGSLAPHALMFELHMLTSLHLRLATSAYAGRKGIPTGHTNLPVRALGGFLLLAA